jgi:hypothetical protein
VGREATGNGVGKQEPRTPVALDPLEKQSTVVGDKKNRDMEISLLTYCRAGVSIRF